MTDLFFYFFSSLFVFSGLQVILSRAAVQAALFLMLTFCAAASIWIMLYAEFLGITLVLVYVGAVMVFFLFVIMMLDTKKDAPCLKDILLKTLPGFLVVLGIASQLLLLANLIFDFSFMPKEKMNQDFIYNNTTFLGYSIYNQYLYPVEIAGLILLVAMIAAISLVLRKKKDTRYSNLNEAVKVKATDRLKLVRFPQKTRGSNYIEE